MEDQPSTFTEEIGTYKEWRDRFIAHRLRVLYIVGLVVNPIFIGLDYLAHHEHLHSLLLIRGILELGLGIGFFSLRLQLAFFKREVLLALWVIIPNICIVHMILLMGQLQSHYYTGLGLVLLTSAVIVPVSWPSHLVAQLTTMGYYYGATFVQGTLFRTTGLLIESLYHLVFVCVALQISIILYERLQRAEFQARQAERKAREEVEASHKKLLDLDRLKGEFFANISHELRTPLTLSIGAFQTLLKRVPTQECQELVHSGMRNASRLLYLINELLDLAKFDSGRATPQPRCLDLVALVRDVAANFDSLPRRIHLRGVTHPMYVEGDPQQLKKVLFNLLSNALKFNENKEDGQVWIRLASHQEHIELEVEDNGIGIPQDYLDRIFDRFSQVEGSATRRYEGTGIGLALVKEIVAAHKGTITVESRLNSGSTFTIRLPVSTKQPELLVQAEEEDETAATSFLIPTDSEGTELKDSESILDPLKPLIIVADDNADMRTYLKRILSVQYSVITAKDGAEALDAAKTLHPELIVSDVMMPRMSGYDLLKELRGDEDLHRIPVIFLTARSGTEAHVESLQAGANDYIPKPFGEQEVLARVDNLIRIRAQERELAQLQKEKLSRFLPLHIGELILSAEADKFLRGHRTDVTVLFIDLRGFTAFSERAEPEELMKVLREYHGAMGQVISEYHGTLEQFSGDGMMVFLNDPLPVPNHPLQTVNMALVMRDRATELCRLWSQRGIMLGAGIGIDTGFATLGAVGFEEHQNYAAIGTVPNLAARLCSEAQNGQILISRRVFHEVENCVQTEPVGELLLKGFQQKVSAYNVLGLLEQQRR
jgi:signal transduction histidine kinase/class 3 adenylate cyclase